MYTFYFEKLTVWQDAMEWVKEIYAVTKNFPDTEKFGLVTQLRRAAVSIPTNLAEGSTRTTKKDQSYFTGLAFSSLMECISLIIISNQLKIIDPEQYKKLRQDAESIAIKLNNLKKSQTE
jgi:four helix bundle protein